ncbi:MAG: hypothetical protein COB37_08860 [Kordiimonadales bacterium]|nr:MAG: hypothetical protein COB37_08860 [Kordiimonadales bacterium]
MSNSLEEIKKERERFVAFSFAAAEIFLELDKNGIIVFEGGASDKIGPEKGVSLIGKNILELIDQDDREVFKALTMHLEYKGRIGPLPIRFLTEANRSAALRVFTLNMPSNNGHTYLALRAAPLGGSGITSADVDQETGLLTKDAFMALATETMVDHQVKSNLYMTAIEVTGLEEAKKRGGPKHMRLLLKQVAAHLKTLSIDGQSAGLIGDKQFAFLHRAKSDGEHLNETLKTVDKNISLTTTFSTMATDEKVVAEDQVLRTLSYVLNKFCADPRKVDFDTLTGAYEDMATKTQQRLHTIKKTIEAGSFKMVFQPVVALPNGEIHHNEVLSRFDETMDDGSPLEIITFAEEFGIIEEFDLALCRKAIDYVRKMKKLGTPTALAINLSGRTLDSDVHSASLVKMLTAATDIAHSLLIELTETSAVQDLEKAEVTLNKIKTCGFKICLDDFGAGAAGYQYLRAFNVDFVKIDGQYIREMTPENYKPTFLLSIVKLCNDLGVKTIGEHVETEFQAKSLAALGVDYGQGFYFGKPEFVPRAN